MPIMPGNARRMSGQNLSRRLVTLVEQRLVAKTPAIRESFTADINVLQAEMNRRFDIADKFEDNQLKLKQ